MSAWGTLFIKEGQNLLQPQNVVKKLNSSTKPTQKRVVEVCSEMFGILAILYWTGWGVPHLPDHVVAGRSLPNMARATCSKVINLIIKTVISNISSAAA